jgi:hypothetical protein
MEKTPRLVSIFPTTKFKTWVCKPLKLKKLKQQALMLTTAHVLVSATTAKTVACALTISVAAFNGVASAGKPFSDFKSVLSEHFSPGT